MARCRGKARLFNGNDDHIGRDLIRLFVERNLFAENLNSTDRSIFAHPQVALNEPPSDVGIFQ